MGDLTTLLQALPIKSPAKVVADRLRKSGWLLPSGKAGVWEFVPAAMAGAYSRNDPLLPVKAFLKKHPDAVCGLTLQSAAWMRGAAERIPIKPQLAIKDRRVVRALPDAIEAFVFNPSLPIEFFNGTPVLRCESILVQIAYKPTWVRSWQSVLEWLPAICAEAAPDDILRELVARPQSVAARTGYLLQGLLPETAAQIFKGYTPPNQAWFGRRGQVLRTDPKWRISDTLLPFDPKGLAAV
jgi:hypothetical protein